MVIGFQRETLCLCSVVLGDLIIGHLKQNGNQVRHGGLEETLISLQESDAHINHHPGLVTGVSFILFQFLAGGQMTDRRFSSYV